MVIRGHSGCLWEEEWLEADGKAVCGNLLGVDGNVLHFGVGVGYVI